MQQCYYYTIWGYHGIILTSKARIACGLATAQSFARKVKRRANRSLKTKYVSSGIFNKHLARRKAGVKE
jgi:hypothetical protein